MSLCRLKDDRDHMIDYAKAGDDVNAAGGDNSDEGENVGVAEDKLLMQTDQESGRASKCGRTKGLGDCSASILSGSTNETVGVVAVVAMNRSRESGVAEVETVPIEAAVLALEKDCIFRAIVCFL